jgi:hypothetical protein
LIRNARLGKAPSSGGAERVEEDSKHSGGHMAMVKGESKEREVILRWWFRHETLRNEYGDMVVWRLKRRKETRLN